MVEADKKEECIDYKEVQDDTDKQALFYMSRDYRRAFEKWKRKANK